MSLSYNFLEFAAKSFIAIPTFYAVKTAIEAPPYVPSSRQKVINTSFSTAIASALCAFSKPRLIPRYTVGGLLLGVPLGLFESKILQK